MKTKNTYSMILNADAEDKGSSIFETAVYGVVILGMAISSWNFATGKVTLPGENRAPKSQQSIMATVPAEQPAPIVIASRG
jgi:hypothetical protein